MNDNALNLIRNPDRLDALRALGLLDTPAEEAFDRLARLAARLLHTPVALVSLVDENRQFFKSCFGLPEPWASWRETPLSHSFCQHVVTSNEPLVISDARIHPPVGHQPGRPRPRRYRLSRHPADAAKRTDYRIVLRDRYHPACLDR